jgi:hypothetical protein
MNMTNYSLGIYWQTGCQNNVLENVLISECKLHNHSESNYIKSSTCLLRYNVVHSVESQPTFRRNMSLCLPSTFTLVSCLAYSSTLKVEATCSLETSVRLSTDYTALYPRR